MVTVENDIFAGKWYNLCGSSFFTSSVIFYLQQVPHLNFLRGTGAGILNWNITSLTTYEVVINEEPLNRFCANFT